MTIAAIREILSAGPMFSDALKNAVANKLFSRGYDRFIFGSQFKFATQCLEEDGGIRWTDKGYILVPPAKD